jgi:ferrous iron transport protein A
LSNPPEPGNDALPLIELAVGRAGVVARVDGAPSLRQRLMEMGVARGQRIEVVRYAPAGDPVEVKVRGYSLSLRRAEAAGILVRPS